MLNLIRAVLGIDHRRFNLFVKCSRLSDLMMLDLKLAAGYRASGLVLGSKAVAK